MIFDWLIIYLFLDHILPVCSSKSKFNLTMSGLTLISNDTIGKSEQRKLSLNYDKVDDSKGKSYLICRQKNHSIFDQRSLILTENLKENNHKKSINNLVVKNNR